MRSETHTFTSSPEVAAVLRRSARWLKPLVVSIGVAVILKLFVIEAVQVPTRSMESTILAGDFILVNKLPFVLWPSESSSSVRRSSFTPMRFGRRTVGRGDILVFEYPRGETDDEAEGSVYFVKRCVGLPGDTVVIRKSRIYVNGRELVFGGDGRERPDESPVDFGPVVVPAAGDTVDLSRGESQWRSLIEGEGHGVERNKKGWIIDGETREHYVVQRMYYFMLGDNLINSFDSRAWGFVPGENLRGEALLVYWSLRPDRSVTSIGDIFNNIRWERIGQIIR